MPVFIAALLGGLVQAAGTLVGKVLISLGIGYVAFSGIDTSIEFARTFVMGQIGAQSAQTVAAASALNIGTCISILTSAITARLVLNGLTGGTLKRMVTK